jgi:putative N6-adenine-specific DNA methylase
MTPYLRHEVENLGFLVDEDLPAGVATYGTLGDTMRLNLVLRTAHRVLFEVWQGAVKTPDELYRATLSVPWEEYIPVDGYVSVISSVETPAITNTQFANVRCKDGIVDRFRQRYGRRPDSGSDTSKTVVFLYWKDEACCLYLDTSGEPLSKRGYRALPWKAPMRESLAAAAILASRWGSAWQEKQRGHFVNPMCGSGTLAIEAALIALNRPAGLLRANFGFMHLVGYDVTSWQALRTAARGAAQKSLPYSIIASDHDAEAIAVARQNARVAGVEHLIDFQVCDVAATPVPFVQAEEAEHTNHVVMLNPEYGERLGNLSKLHAEYQRIGDFFKQHCQQYTGYIFTGALDAAKSIGLRTKRRIPFINGDIECRLLEYELYPGSRHPK